MTSSDHDQGGSPDLLTARQGYLAMYHFVTAYFDRGGRRDEGLVMLTTNLKAQDDPNDPNGLWTDDPAFWTDWLEAVRKAKSDGA